MMGNNTHPAEFILIGFSMTREFQKVLFASCLALYIVTIAGNASIVAMISFDSRLHTPMYFFLGNFSVAEMLLTCTVVPRMLVGLLAERDTIPFGECFGQMYFYFSSGSAMLLLMAIMSIDRYVAICHPLHYSTIMTNTFCIQLAFGAWATSFFYLIPPTIVIVRLPFCGSNQIDHFFCDNAPLLKLSCSDTHLLEFWGFLLAVLFILSSFTVTVSSYVAIIFTIMRIPSATGRQKAFSTCASHFAVVTIGYSTNISIYVSRSDSTDLNKIGALLTSIVAPVLSPFIFTLRNEKVKEVFRDWWGHLRSL